jgi:hypothetical protein
MGKNIIVSEETVRDLLEAHASLSAWYYELWAALRAANATARSPDDAARTAFVERLCTDFPEIAAVAKTIDVPRMFVPAPPAVAACSSDAPAAPVEEPATLIEPAPARVRESQAPASRRAGDDAPPLSTSAAVAPPPLVVPSEVKYSR